MTDRPPWVANRIADLALDGAREQKTLARIRALTGRAREAGLLLDPDEVEAVLDGAEDDQGCGRIGSGSRLEQPRPASPIFDATEGRD